MNSPARSFAAASEPLPAPFEVADIEAVNAVLRGNREMFEVIVRRHNAQLYRAGMAYLQDHGQTEDAMQNAYLKAFLHLDRFHGRSSFGTWLTRIMINECLMMLRAKKRFVLETLAENGSRPADEPSVPAAAEPLLNAEEKKAVLEEAIQTLPRNHRAVYLLREVQRLSTEETAHCLGISRDNVKVLLHRAREGLKRQLLQNAAALELFDYVACYCDPMTARVMAAIRALPDRFPPAS